MVPAALTFAVASAIIPCGPFGTVLPSASLIRIFGGSTALYPETSTPGNIFTCYNLSNGAVILPLPIVTG